MKSITLKLALFLYLLIASNGWAGMLGRVAEINQSATHYVSLYYSANPEIVHSTPDIEAVSCFLTKPDLSVVAYSVAASGENHLATGYSSNSVSVGIPSAYLDQYGAYEIVVNASDCLKNIPFRFRVVSEERYDETRDGLTSLITASGNIVPASGMTRPIMSFGEITGDYERNLWLEGLCTTSATPTVAIELFAASGTGLVLWATESAFTYSYYMTHDGLYRHRYKLSIANTYPDDWYVGMFHCQVAGSMVATPFCFQKSATTVVDTSNIVTQTMFNAFVSNASQSFDALMSGHPNRFQMFTTIDTLARAQAGVSSAQSRHATAGAIYGASVSYENYFDGETKSATWVYDYDETDETRSKNIPLDDSSLDAQAIIDDVTLSTAGGS